VERRLPYFGDFTDLDKREAHNGQEDPAHPTEFRLLNAQCNKGRAAQNKS
jgi:hypothetical protein